MEQNPAAPHTHLQTSLPGDCPVSGQLGTESYMLGATHDKFSIASAVTLHFTMKHGPAEPRPCMYPCCLFLSHVVRITLVYSAGRHVIQGCLLVLPDRSLEWMAGEGQVFVELMRSVTFSVRWRKPFTQGPSTSHDHQMI